MSAEILKAVQQIESLCSPLLPQRSNPRVIQCCQAIRSAVAQAESPPGEGITASDRLRYFTLQIEELLKLLRGSLGGGMIAPNLPQAHQLIDRIVRNCLDLRACLADQHGLYRLKIQAYLARETLTDIFFHSSSDAEAKRQAREYVEFFIEQMRLSAFWRNEVFHYDLGVVTPTLDLQAGVFAEPAVQRLLHQGGLDDEGD